MASLRCSAAEVSEDTLNAFISHTQAADAVSAYTQVKMEDAHKLFKNSKIGVSRHLDSSTKTQMA